MEKSALLPDSGEAVGCARPVSGKCVRSRGSGDPAKHQSGDDYVVGEPNHWYDIRDQVDRRSDKSK
jgi:hypothetical protein